MSVGLEQLDEMLYLWHLQHFHLSCFLTFFLFQQFFSQPDLDWDEEFALQDFLKNELAVRNSWLQDGKKDYPPERVEEEDGEKRWTVVDTAGEGEVRDTSTPLSLICTDVQPDQSTSEGRRGRQWQQ